MCLHSSGIIQSLSPCLKYIIHFLEFYSYQYIQDFYHHYTIEALYINDTWHDIFTQFIFYSRKPMKLPCHSLSPHFDSLQGSQKWLSGTNPPICYRSPISQYYFPSFLWEWKKRLLFLQTRIGHLFYNCYHWFLYLIYLQASETLIFLSYLL